MSGIDNWQLEKPAVSSTGGVVVSQHYTASRIGANVLEEGGNAIDAAIATSFAIGVLEPWQSGLGGIGHLLVAIERSGRTFEVDFSARAPIHLDPLDYRLTGKSGSGMFGWPAVIDDRNLEGPYSIGVPGLVAGLALAHREFSETRWARLVEPAIRCASDGLQVDWYLTLKIAAAAKGLARFASSSSTYLPGGYVPSGDWSGDAPRIRLESLSATLRCIAEQGAEDFYRGSLAERIATDLAAIGSNLGADDLSAYHARISQVEPWAYGESAIATSSATTAGPALLRALELFRAGKGGRIVHPDGDCMSDIAQALKRAFEERMGNRPPPADAQRASCTTHISVLDRQGNAVSLTQTLLSMFGSKVMLPGTGIVMNNAMMWFDPRPDRPNSITPGAVPLSNICPTIVKRANGDVIALGASGGRRIMPAVMQLVVYLINCGMSIEEAMHFPRLDVSGDARVTADDRFEDDVLRVVGGHHEIKIAANRVAPNLFGCPNAASRSHATGEVIGCAFASSPWAAAVGAQKDAIRAFALDSAG